MAHVMQHLASRDVIAPFPPNNKKQPKQNVKVFVSDLLQTSTHFKIFRSYLYHHSNHCPKLLLDFQQKRKKTKVQTSGFFFGQIIQLENGYTRRSDCYCTATSKPCPKNQASVSLHVTAVKFVLLMFLIF